MLNIFSNYALFFLYFYRLYQPKVNLDLVKPMRRPVNPQTPQESPSEMSLGSLLVIQQAINLSLNEKSDLVPAPFFSISFLLILRELIFFSKRFDE